MENRTIQNFFKKSKSSKYFLMKRLQKERLILEAAIQAPTANNMSLFSILDIQSQEIKIFLQKR